MSVGDGDYRAYRRDYRRDAIARARAAGCLSYGEVAAMTGIPAAAVRRLWVGVRPAARAAWRGVQRDVVDSLVRLGPCLLRDVCADTGRERPEVYRALAALVSRGDVVRAEVVADGRPQGRYTLDPAARALFASLRPGG